MLFFGTIRRYKGLSLLLEAMSKVPSVELGIAGEFWEDEKKYRKEIEELGLSERVTVRAGYVAEKDFGTIFSQHDVLVMPYLSGTGSIVRELAFRFGLPVIATRTGSIAEGVVNDINGLVIHPARVDELIRALEKASSKDTVATWQAGVLATARNQDQTWESYVNALLADSGTTVPAADSGGRSS
jgi:glycosyltransferase involved in cell wall biosynthesis